MWSNFHFLSLLLLFLKKFCFLGGTNMRYFKVCLTVRVFVWTVNHAKIDPLSENLDIFLKQMLVHPKLWSYVRYFLQGRIKIFFNLFEESIFQCVLQFLYICFCWKGLVFMMILLLLVLPSDNLMFFCLSVSAKNQVKIDPLSQNLNVFKK